MAPNNPQQTDKAGIIATFYGPRDKIEGLTNVLGAALGLIAQAFPERQYLSASDKGRYLRYFDPPAAADTRVVQFALSEAGEAQLVWETLCQKLANNIELKESLDPLAEQKALWGYSLVYHAAVVQNVTLDEPARDALLRLARRPGLPPEKRAEWLAHTNVMGADLWLMDIPNEGEGSQAATVYVALSAIDKENDMITKLLYGPGALLLMPDLIAHKSYYQMRQYSGQRTKRYKKRVEALRKQITPLLNLPVRASEGSQTGKQPDEVQQLAQLSEEYASLLMVISLFDELRIALAQQLENYTWWEEELGEGNVASYHKQQVRTAYRELELLIENGQRMQEAARTTIEMVQTKLQQARDKRENRTNLLIGILGVALAVSQIINETAAKAMLKTGIGQFILDVLNYLPWWSLTPYNRLLQLCVQFLITIFVTVVIYLIYKKWRPN